jgi:hypothetical protein
MGEITSRLIKVLKPIENGKIISILSFLRCMDIHLKKLNEIKRANTVKRNDDTKKVEENLHRRH